MPTLHLISRSYISLDTGNDSDQHNDQICALSAKTNNANFEALFKQRPKIKDLTLNDRTHGVVKTIVRPPRIMINPNQERAKDPEIYFQMSFVILFSMKISDNVFLPSSMCASAALNDDANTKFHKKKVRNELMKTFDSDGNMFILDNATKVTAGECSIHRLFAALTIENTWNNPLYEYSTVPSTDGKPIPFKDWAAGSSMSVNAATRAKETLEYWSLKHEYSACFTLGLQLRLPDPQGQYSYYLLTASPDKRDSPYFSTRAANNLLDNPWKPTFD
ncbi:hypothetical protein F4782DRAFT_545003 [Xylaria castorea]|nr:hypothetical protein F4782DRAFT_545003 [Xylaria castorea]